jgi:urocanate hydratase
MVGVADGSENSRRRLERVLTSDPGMGILRHVDAGYSRAIEFAAAHNIDIPMQAKARD